MKQSFQITLTYFPSDNISERIEVRKVATKEEIQQSRFSFDILTEKFRECRDIMKKMTD